MPAVFNDDPQDTGVAGIDIFKRHAAGMAIGHWDTMQLVGNSR
jgi:hypothetical protein